MALKGGCDEADSIQQHVGDNIGDEITAPQIQPGQHCRHGSDRNELSPVKAKGVDNNKREKYNSGREPTIAGYVVSCSIARPRNSVSSMIPARIAKQAAYTTEPPTIAAA